MKEKPSSRRKRSSAKSVLRLPDLEHAKSAVLNSLNSADAKRGYHHAIDEFVDWYCSEPRLAFNRIVVLRYRSHLESRQLAPGTLNLRLGAVRRPDTQSQPPDPLHTPNACRKIRAKKSAIGCFIRQPAYRCQSQVNRRRGVRAPFECDSVPCDHGPVEGYPGLRAVPFDEFTNGMVVRAL
jgi:hypothetical protein